MLAYRDALEHLLPMIYADPSLARDVLLYSAQQVPRPGSGQQIPYGMGAQCRPVQLGTSTDLDLWLLLAAAEYGLATRDLRTFSSTGALSATAAAARCGRTCARAFRHQESLRGPHGGYDAGSVGDWSDLSPSFLGMTESLLVTAQLAYVYPRLAELADLRGDRAFAAALRASGARDLATTRAAWTGAAGTRAATPATSRSARARSSASRSRGRCSPARRPAPRRRRWWRTSAAS